MGIFKKKENIEYQVENYFKLINGYSPTFSTFEGGIYEMELTRSAINTFATHVSKLKPEVIGQGNNSLNRILQFKPNAIMDTKKYLYRLATIREVNNNAYITPLYDSKGNINGFYPLVPSKSQIIVVDGKKYLRYQFDTHIYGAIEFEKIGILNQHQYKDEMFGESNVVMQPTLELMDANNQGISNAIKNSAVVRFLAKLNGTYKPADIKAERERFKSENLTTTNNGGVMMFDSKYEDVKQITTQQYVVDTAQMNQIKENVFNYFGTNEKILQNSFTPDEWASYYEGKIEPFAIEMGLVHSNMAFTEREIAFGNEIMFSANRLQYLSNNDKLNLVTQLFDRGFMSHNQGLEVFNMPPVEDGDKRYIRKEYALEEEYNQEGGYDEL